MEKNRFDSPIFFSLHVFIDNNLSSFMNSLRRDFFLSIGAIHFVVSNNRKCAVVAVVNLFWIELEIKQKHRLFGRYYLRGVTQFYAGHFSKLTNLLRLLRINDLLTMAVEYVNDIVCSVCTTWQCALAASPSMLTWTPSPLLSMNDV